MHLNNVRILSEKFPTADHYPFNQRIFRETYSLDFTTPVTFFVGENGTGKSTLLEALSRRCGIYIWRDGERLSMEANPYVEALQYCLQVEWANGKVPGSFFSSGNFQHFTYTVDQWAAADDKVLDYFGGKSLVTQSHGQSIMSFFRSRYQIRGLHLLDEPETALSPRSQIALLRLLRDMGNAGHAQFIIATHSPILLACPGASIYSFDRTPVAPTTYEETPLYRIFKDFMEDQNRFLEADIDEFCAHDD
ncbi:MAG: AAA family ATPase [Gemmatimonadetes bacterium]|jgi:predicted ATPase|nr:AAA family ATPase [Gemmatimonadota bacterium]